MKQLTLVSDPGHGWLRVPMSDRVLQSIATKISSYSFISDGGEIAFLEEDCDAEAYLSALDERGITYEIKHKYVDYFSRNRRRFMTPG